GARTWYNMILNPGSDGGTGATGEAGAEAVTDAVTAATGAAAVGGGEVAASMGTAIINWDFLGLFQTILVSGKELAESKIADLAFKLDVPLILWFIDTLILPNDGVQIFMQASIVIL